MPRRARVSLAGVPHHIIQRGNNREACFYTERNYLIYLEWLREYAIECECAVHAYVLMTNHVHLLLTPSAKNGAGILMKRLGQRYVQYINRTYRRSGTLWEGRFKSCLVQSEDYVLGCYKYIELNPVRASMVEHPANYRWSSYTANAQGDVNLLLDPHETYLELGGNDKLRNKRYRELFRYSISPGLVGEIRIATNGNYALGNDKFKRQIEATLGRRVTPGVSGRPCTDKVNI
jgi:putative transposase